MQRGRNKASKNIVNVKYQGYKEYEGEGKAFM